MPESFLINLGPCVDWVRAWGESNRGRPIQKYARVREFLDSHAIDGGVVPRSLALEVDFAAIRGPMRRLCAPIQRSG